MSMNVVNERRLRSVYDALDGMHYKKVIQEADKVLKKDPDLHTAKILKAIALLRMGKPNEAESIIQSFDSKPPIDDASLEAFSLYFRETKSRVRFTKIMEYVITQRSNDELALLSLFKCYVREFNYSGQMNVVRQLQKLNSTDKNYFFYNIMTNVVQGRHNPALATKMYFPLAKKMLLNIKSPLSLQEARLLLAIYECEENSTEQLQYIDNFYKTAVSKEKLVDEREYLRIQQTVLMKEYSNDLANRYEDALKTHLIKYPDDIHHWNLLVDFCFRHGVFEHLPSHENSSLKINALYDLLESQKPNIRGVGQAKLFYQLRWEQMKLRDGKCEISTFSITQLLQEYFMHFGSRPSCALDLTECLTSWIQHLGLERVKLLRETFANCLDSPKSDNANDCYKIINLEAVQQYLGFYDDLPAEEVVETRLKLVHQLCAHYQNAWKLGDTLTTTYNPGDFLLCLAVNHLFKCAQLGHSKYLLLAICLLEFGIASSPANHNLRIQLVRLYTLYCAYPAARDHFRLLDVKQLLLDSFSYPLLDLSHRCGQLAQAFSQYHLVSSQRQRHYFELEESLVVAYKERNGPSVIQFTDFYARIKNSFVFESTYWYKLALTMVVGCPNFQFLLDFITENQLASKLSEIEFDVSHLVDGRDFSVFPRYFHKGVSERQKQSFLEEVLWLKLRRAMCVLVLHAVQLSMDNSVLVDAWINAPTTTEFTLETTRYSALQACLGSLQKLQTEAKDCLTLSTTNMDLLPDPLPSMAHHYFKGENSFAVLLDNGTALLLHFRQFIVSSQDSTNAQVQFQSVLVDSLVQQWVILEEGHNTHDWQTSPPSSCMELFSKLIVLVESCSFVVLILSMFHSIFNPLRTFLQPPKKSAPAKKRGNTAAAASSTATLPIRAENVLSVRNDWKTCVTNMLAFVKDKLKPLMQKWENTLKGDLQQADIMALADNFQHSVTLLNHEVGDTKSCSLVTLVESTILDKVLNSIQAGHVSNFEQMHKVVQAKDATLKALLEDASLPGVNESFLTVDDNCGLFRR